MLSSSVWDRTHWPGLPSLDCDVATDVCVIGLGGSGLACVTELLAMGRRVVGVDAAQVASGAAGRNGGILRPGAATFHHDAVRTLGRERALGLYRLTLAALHRFAEESPETVRLTGLLRLAASDAEYADCVAQRDAMVADGLRAERYVGALGRGLYLPDGGAMQPLERCRARARRAVDAGARLFERTRACAFSGTEVVTEHGRVKCSAVVVAVDGGLEALVPELGGVVRTARLQMLATAPEHAVTLPCPVSLNSGYDYAQQLPDGTVAIGGGRDRDVDAEWTTSGEPTPRIQEHIEGVLRGQLGVRAAVTHRWASTVSYSAAGLPVLAEVRAGVWAIGGYNGTGNLPGALAGQAAARATCGEACEFASLLLAKAAC